MKESLYSRAMDVALECLSFSKTCQLWESVNIVKLKIATIQVDIMVVIPFKVIISMFVFTMFRKNNSMMNIHYSLFSSLLLLNCFQFYEQLNENMIKLNVDLTFSC